MPTILLVADRQRVIDRVHTSLVGTDFSVVDHADPDTAASVAYESGVDVVLVDMRVGSMGSMAVTRSVAAQAATDPTLGGQAIPVTILLDRDADAFIAHRAGARNWIGKDDSAADVRAALLAASQTP